MWMRRARPHGNERCPVILRCLQLDADSMRSARPVIADDSLARWCACTTALQMHTRQWIGTYAGRGNGDYREELASALQAITTYLKHFAFTAEMALVRLDGQYGDAAVIAQLMLAGVYLVTRGEAINGLRASSDPGCVGSSTDSEGDRDEHRGGHRAV